MRPENLTSAHIAKAMRLTVGELLALADDPRKAYGTPRWRPVGSKMRLITPPRRHWKARLKWFNQFLRRNFGWDSAAHGSVPGRSPFTAAGQHLGVRNILCHDVKDAFPSVHADRFYLEMLAFGFGREMACLLTKLLLPDGYIPQGGPTSNAALDLFFFRIDADIRRELSALHARYTRFTDGLDASFRNAAHREEAGRIIERNLARLGLRVNESKLDKNGWQPIGRERVICGVRVNSATGTQLPRLVLRNIISGCESLLRGAHTVAAHTLPGLAARRRSLQGSLNQASQADIAPVRDLQRRLLQVDHVMRVKFSALGIVPCRQWYTKGKDFDEAVRLAECWRRRTARVA